MSKGQKQDNKEVLTVDGTDEQTEWGMDFW